MLFDIDTGTFQACKIVGRHLVALADVVGSTNETQVTKMIDIGTTEV